MKLVNFYSNLHITNFSAGSRRCVITDGYLNELASKTEVTNISVCFVLFAESWRNVCE